MTNNALQQTAVKQPVVWCIGGIDSSGGAGITRDAITLADLKVHACVITTQATVQSNTVMLSKESMTVSALNQQWQVLSESTQASAIKIGAIANDEQALLLCARIQSLAMPRPFVVWDPVLRTSSGGKLSELSEPVVEALLNTVDLVTPNTQELSWLTNMPVKTDDSLRAAAYQLIENGAHAVYVKGGHASWQTQACDTFVSPTQTIQFTQPRKDNGKLRGTGCMLASAIAAFVVHDYCIEDALTLANAYVSQVRKDSCASSAHTPATNTYEARTYTPAFGRCVGFPRNPASFPLVKFSPREPLATQTFSLDAEKTPLPQSNTAISPFKPLTQTHLGLYPVVNSVEWIERLLPAEANIIQLRVKQGTQEDIRQQIKEAIALTKHTHCQLFINDYWELAIELGAFGVHLGQEDIDTADLHAIRKAGTRLGISTHGFAEIQRVRQLKPSYIALGHIFPTNTKEMPSKPQGIERLSKYVELCEGIPTVAIGGINLARIADVAKTGVSGIAVVSAVTQVDDPLHAFYALSKEAGFA